MRCKESPASAMTTLEPAERPMPGWPDIIASLDRHMVTNATVAWLYAITGPLAILLAVASRAGFAQDQVAAWIFGGYAVGGFLSILMSCLYRQPTGVASSIPGAILIGPALDHLSFAEVVGASIAAGLFIDVVRLTRLGGQGQGFFPVPGVGGGILRGFLAIHPI